MRLRHSSSIPDWLNQALRTATNARIREMSQEGQLFIAPVITRATATLNRAFWRREARVSASTALQLYKYEGGAIDATLRSFPCSRSPTSPTGCLSAPPPRRLSDHNICDHEGPSDVEAAALAYDCGTCCLLRRHRRRWFRRGDRESRARDAQLAPHDVFTGSDRGMLFALLDFARCREVLFVP